MKRTETNHTGTALFQGHKITYNFLYTGCFNDLVYGLFRNQTIYLEFKISDFFVLKIERLINQKKISSLPVQTIKMLHT